MAGDARRENDCPVCNHELTNRQLGPHGTFWLYGAICVVGFWLIATRLPETKGKSLEELERELLGGQ